MKRLASFNVGNGYTVVEVLIFLAITGVLIVAAGALISGRQERTRFSQSVDTMAQQLEDVFNDVSTGYYPSNNKLACTDAGSRLNLVDSATTVEQGTNSDCVFSGKLVNLTLNSTNFDVYTVVSSRQTTSFMGGLHELAGIGTNAGVVDNYSTTADARIIKVFEKDVLGAEADDFTSLIIESDFGSDTGAGVSGNASKVKLYGYKDPITQDPLKTGPSDFPGKIKQIPIDSQIIICIEQPSTVNSRVATISITSQLRIERIIGEKDPKC